MVYVLLYYIQDFNRKFSLNLQFLRDDDVLL